MKNHGFSLIEILVTMAIIAVLVGVMLPKYDRYVARAKQTEPKVSLKAILVAQESYKLSHQVYTNQID